MSDLEIKRILLFKNFKLSNKKCCTG